MQFKDIKGNTSIKKNLISSVKNNRLSHSQIFCGNSGSAKLPLAIAFSQYINCNHRISEDSCGLCSSCIKFNNLSHPDLHLIFPVLSINGIKKVVSDNFVNEWRQEVLKNPYLSLNNWFNVFSDNNKTGKTGYIYTQETENLNKKLTLKNYESEYRIVLIWLPEKMQTVTSNKLLKLIEEPPKKTILLLVSENPELLLSTILSRLQITKITNFSKTEIKEIVKENFPQKEEELIDFSISYSNGNLGESLQLLTQENFKDKNFEYYQKWMRLCYSVNIKELTYWVNDITSMGRILQSVFLKYSLKMVRNCLVYNFSDSGNLYTTKQEKKFLNKFHPFINEINIFKITSIIEESIIHIERNANAKIMFYELSLQLMKQLKVKRKFVQ